MLENPEHAIHLICKLTPFFSGHQYALTLIGSLWAVNVWCTTKETDEAAYAYLHDLYAIFRGSMKILPDNGSGSKNFFPRY